MEYLKEGVHNLNKEIFLIKQELGLIKSENSMYKTYLDKLEIFLNKLNKENLFLKEEINSLRSSKLEFPLNSFFKEHLNPLQEVLNITESIPFPVYSLSFKPLKGENYNISIGNQGVPTDRQTNQQTDRQTFNIEENASQAKDSISQIDSALSMLNSLDSIKKEIRLKFKKLTDQELLVFSTVYQFDEEKGFSSYKMIASKLNLTESSIRDYIGKIIRKGIPIEKTKLNNKEIQLNISKTLKKLTSLNTIIQLREI
jgi:hypothetical protein